MHSVREGGTHGYDEAATGGEALLLTLRAAAAAVLRANDAGRWTIPASRIYPHQWNWDSAICSLGWAEIDPGRAWTELESLVGGRARDGMLPHIAFRRREHGPGREGPVLGRVAVFHRTSYLPGAAWWGDRRGVDGRPISGITQPPLAATCLRLVLERVPDERRATRLLWPLHEWHRFLLRERDPDGLGEPVLIHPWESGRDNAPEWDRPLFRVEPRLMYVRRRDTAHIDAAERPSAEHYKRYLTLVVQGTDAGWPQRRLAASGPFRVLDPGFSAVLARACHDLSEVAGALGSDEIAGESAEFAERVAGALRRRAGAGGGITALDLVDGAALDAPSAGPALAVLAPGVDRATVEHTGHLLVRELASRWGVRSYAERGPVWSPRNYWRGPVWANLTWLCALGFELHGETERAEALRAQVLRFAEEAGMREYVDPRTGHGLGARRFSWTAALTLRVLGDEGRRRSSQP